MISINADQIVGRVNQIVNAKTIDHPLVDKAKAQKFVDDMSQRVSVEFDARIKQFAEEIVRAELVGGKRTIPNKVETVFTLDHPALSQFFGSPLDLLTLKVAIQQLQSDLRIEGGFDKATVKFTQVLDRWNNQVASVTIAIPVDLTSLQPKPVATP